MSCPPQQPDRADDLIVADQHNFINPDAPVGAPDDVESQRGGNPRGDAVGKSARVLGLDDAAFFPGEIDARRAFGLRAVDSGFGRKLSEGCDYAANAAPQPDGNDDRVDLLASFPHRLDNFDSVSSDAVDQIRLVGGMDVPQVFGF